MSIVLQSSSGGSVTIAEPTTASNFTQTLPASTGTVLTTGSPQSGGVIQVVSLTNSTQVSTTSTSYITTGLTVSITPKFSTSKVLIIVNYTCYDASLNNGDYHTIYRNSTNLATGGTPGFVQSYANLANNFAFQVAMSHVDSPATTSATSYTAYFKSGSGQSVQTNWSNNSGSITVMEIAA